MIRKNICGVIIVLLLYPYICNAMVSGMLNRSQIAERLMQRADNLIDRGVWFSKLEKKGWKAAGIAYKFQQHICSDKDVEYDRNVVLEMIKEMLGKGTYTSPLLEQMRMKNKQRGELGISTRCGEKIHKLERNQALYQKEFEPYSNKMRRYLEIETKNASTQISQDMEAKNKWSAMQLVRRVISKHMPEFSEDKERSTSTHKLFCKQVSTEFDACLGIDVRSFRDLSSRSLQMALLFLPVSVKKLTEGEDLLFIFGFDDYFSPIDPMIYSFYSTANELERNTKFMLDAYKLILDDISECFE